jgi:hypothetical protein
MGVVVDKLQLIRRRNGYQTDVKTVSEVYEGYDQISVGKLPALYPLDGSERHEEIAFRSGAAYDMSAELEVIVTAVVHSNVGATRRQRTRLLRDIQKAMATVLSESTLADFIRAVLAREVTTDNGSTGKYSVFDYVFVVTYNYDSDTGG